MIKPSDLKIKLDPFDSVSAISDHSEKRLVYCIAQITCLTFTDRITEYVQECSSNGFIIIINRFQFMPRSRHDHRKGSRRENFRKRQSSV